MSRFVLLCLVSLAVLASPFHAMAATVSMTVIDEVYTFRDAKTGKDPVVLIGYLVTGPTDVITSANIKYKFYVADVTNRRNTAPIKKELGSTTASKQNGVVTVPLSGIFTGDEVIVSASMVDTSTGKETNLYRVSILDPSTGPNSLVANRQIYTHIGNGQRPDLNTAKEYATISNALSKKVAEAVTKSGSTSTTTKQGSTDSSETKDAADTNNGSGGSGETDTATKTIGLTTTRKIRPSIEPTLRVTRVNNVYKADLVWKAIPSATQYIIQTVDKTAAPTVLTDLNDKTLLQRTQAGYLIYHIGDVQSKNQLSDEYTLIARLQDGSSISGKTRNADTVVAPTEFGLVSNIGEYAENIVGFALPIGIILAVLMTIYAGSKLMWDSKDPEEFKKSREIIGGAIMGILLLIFARVFANFLSLQPIGFTQEDSYRDFSTGVDNTVQTRETNQGFLQNILNRTNR